MWKNPNLNGNGAKPRAVSAWKKIDQRIDRALQDVELTLAHTRNNTDMANLVKHKDKVGRLSMNHRKGLKVIRRSCKLFRNSPCIRQIDGGLYTKGVIFPKIRVKPL